MNFVSTKRIDEFFNNMKSVLSSDLEDICNYDCKNCQLKSCVRIDQIDTNKKSLVNKVDDKPGEQRTNVIYLNTDCNLRCEYCYEANSRNGLPDQADCTPDDIDNFLNEISIREKGRVSTIVIMGGEPFLRFKLIQYTILKAASMNKEGGWGISLVTNGTFFRNDNIIKMLKDLIKFGKLCGVSISLEVSFDVSGQYRRKWPDGANSKKVVEQGLQNLIKFEVPFKISYVAHSGNYKNLVEDCIYVLEKYPLPYHYRMTVGYAYEDLDKELGPEAGHRLKEWFKPYAHYLFELYKVPICGNTCEVCGQCGVGNFVGNSYLSPTTGISYDEKVTGHKFKQF